MAWSDPEVKRLASAHFVAAADEVGAPVILQASAGARKYAAYSTIARGLQMPYNQVQHICRKAMQGEKPVT